MKDDTATINFRVPSSLKTDFEAATHANDITVSQILRNHMRWYVSRYLPRPSTATAPPQMPDTPPETSPPSPPTRETEKSPTSDKKAIQQHFKSQKGRRNGRPGR